MPMLVAGKKGDVPTLILKHSDGKSCRDQQNNKFFCNSIFLRIFAV
jgi:hypothetical protein